MSASIEERKEDAQNAFEKARTHSDAGQDAIALKILNISLRLYETPEALALKEWIEAWGADSPAGLKARSELQARTYYEIFDIQCFAPFPIPSLKKKYLTLSRDLHPDKSKARQAEDAFKLLGLAHSTLTDEYQKARYDCKLQGLPPPPKPAGYGEPATSSPAGPSPREQRRRQREEQQQEEPAEDAETKRARSEASTECAAIVKGLKGPALRYVCEKQNLTKGGTVQVLSMRVSMHFQAVTGNNADPTAGLRRLQQLIADFEQ
jgi:hypothetical protein